MRLDAINRIATSFPPVQVLDYARPKELRPSNPKDYRLSWKRRLASVAGPALVTAKQPFFKMHFPFLKEIRPDRICGGERFSLDCSYRALRHRMRKEPHRMLIAGCNYNSAEVRLWLRHQIPTIQCLDIVDWSGVWERAEYALSTWYPASQLRFSHGTLENIPFQDGEFDFVTTQAVLEHVRNVDAMCSETARVLKQGAYAWHGFGPLYFTHGGDHTIGALGAEHGYDHLLLDDEAYSAILADEDRFNRVGNAASDSRYWAIQNQFSFLRPAEYLEKFRRYFEIVHLTVKINPAARLFRLEHSDSYQQLLGAGLSETDLLVKGMFVVLQKK